MPEPTPLHEVTARRGAEFGEEAGWFVPVRFGDVAAEYRAAREKAALFDVSPRSKVELRGGDAVKFLQNLSTNDVAALAPGDGCELFLTNLQAKVVAHAVAYRVGHGDHPPALWLDADPGQADKIIKHLDRYIISEDVELADYTREYAQVRLAGPEARPALERALKQELPDLREHQHLAREVGAGSLCFIRREDPLGVPGYDVLCPAARGGEVWEVLHEAGAVPAGRSAYEILRVEAGAPEYGKDVDENNLAPEVGRTRQAICYTKGCFLGQEPLVRIRDLGHVNRSLVGLELAGPEAVPPGTKLWREGKEVGQVTSAVVSPRRQAGVALAYVRRGSEKPGTELEVETAAGRRSARVAALPFPA